MSEDITLLNRARAGDSAALGAIHDRYYDAIFRYLTFRVADTQTAEDLASDVFIRFLSAIRDRSNPPNNLRGWLYGAASNVLKEHYRRQKRMGLVDLADTVPGRETGPEQRLVDKQQVQRLRGALADLTDDQQDVLALRFGFGMPIKEVAETMNKTEGSVKMLQARAIMALSRRLETQEDVN